jgi:hypothetical protein
MSRASRAIFIVAGLVLFVGLAFATYYFSEVSNETAALSASLAVLETEKAQLSEDLGNLVVWNSYQSTQIGAHQLALQGLTTEPPGGSGSGQGPTFTPTPYEITLTPWDRPTGVMIEGGDCCVGGTAGETIDVVVQFLPWQTELTESAVEMRVITGVANVYAGDMVNQPWESLAEEKAYPVYLAINWTTFWVHVQYRTAAGEVSAIYSDEIGVEGMPGMTGTP